MKMMNFLGTVGLCFERAATVFRSLKVYNWTSKVEVNASVWEVVVRKEISIPSQLSIAYSTKHLIISVPLYIKAQKTHSLTQLSWYSTILVVLIN